MRRRDRIWKWIAYHLPRRLVYWAAMRMLAEATTGPYAHQEVPKLTFMMGVARWGLGPRP